MHLAGDTINFAPVINIKDSPNVSISFAPLKTGRGNTVKIEAQEGSIVKRMRLGSGVKQIDVMPGVSNDIASMPFYREGGPHSAYDTQQLIRPHKRNAFDMLRSHPRKVRAIAVIKLSSFH